MVESGADGPQGEEGLLGYTLQVAGKQERKFFEEWSKEDAQNALAGRLLERAPPPPAVPKTLGQVGQEYLDYKRGKGKRSIRQDEQILAELTAQLSADTPITDITAQRVAQYKRDRVVEKSKLGQLVTPSTINRELAILRHLLRLAEEWGYIAKVPKIRLGREPEGRLRFLAEEESRAFWPRVRRRRLRPRISCRLSPSPCTRVYGRGEILGLAWERVDFARGVLQLEHIKSGRPREVPMNRAVYDALAGLPGPKAEGFVFRKRDGRAWGNIRTAFQDACREAKVDNFRFHDLRHTCASWLVMKGRSLTEVQESLGHREFTMSLRYARLSPDRLRDAVASLEGFSTRSALSAKIEPACSINPHAPVAQVDRAAVS